jgi:DNA-binding CsgD family transcriptional regulator
VHRVEDHIVLSVSRGTAERLEGFKKDPLPVRELEVLLLEALLLEARAISNGRTASHLHISPGTVKRHRSNIYAKFGAPPGLMP